MNAALLARLHRAFVCPVRGHRVPTGTYGRCIDCGKPEATAEWMGVRVEGPPELIRDVLTILADRGLGEIEECHLERPRDTAWADYYPATPPRNGRYPTIIDHEPGG